MLYENFLFTSTYHKALGIKDIDRVAFSIRTLYNFRATMYAYETRTGDDISARIFKKDHDAIIEELGIKTDIQRANSVQISANIKRMGRFTLLHKTLSNLVKAVKLHEPASISAELFFLVDYDEDSCYHKLKKLK